MYSRRHETNPHFLPPESLPSDQNAPSPSGLVPQPAINQPRRQRTPRGPHLERHYPLQGPDQDPRSQLEGPPGQVFVPRGRGPSRATVLLPESPDYPDHYPLHRQGKGSHSISPGGLELPPPRRGKSGKSRDQREQPPPETGEEHARPPGRPVPQTPHVEPEESRRNRQDLQFPRRRKAKFITWFFAICCALFWIVIIVGGLIVLIVYLLFRPHIPRFDIPSATLNAAYLDMDYLLNADLTLLANFTNPNRKVRVDFSYVILDLYYRSIPIATQYIEPFSTMRSESKFANVHMISSQVRLPLRESQLLRKQIESNGPVPLEVKGLFRARSNLGSLLRYSYSLHSHCSIVLTGPPSGVLRATHCRTKR
ncbi:uncharacterized protein LOC116210560 [Punica granatum]|uniref:Late embryogenesis abundant protein LEA-2 subgroup domain-containing protein n=2 Tax=Punica granatum TaxID=22663 RepID=A0A218WTZ2_PUNGR|nr:uncharacterized protein LOC116210560 [Punica granatum]OWM76133.1 hypothetical protein CDL15_Pgr009779 [Punica granatum]PKI77110.1 hypothetical protein CRG98_002613 [Punica granatum]